MVIAAALLRCIPAIALPNFWRADEVFQNLEPAFRMISGGGVVTWEWHAGIRSPIFPAFLSGLMAISGWLGLGPRGALAVIHAVLSLLAAGTAAVGFELGWRRASWGGALLCGGLCAVWPDLVYFGPKTLAEVQAGNLLILALWLVTGRRGPRALVLAGVLFGLVLCLRFHLLPAVTAACAWRGRLQLRRAWLPLVLGLAVPLLTMGVVDWLYWGVPFQSMWLNYRINLLDGVSTSFGAEPGWWYLGGLAGHWGMASLPLAIAILLGLRRAPLLGLVAGTIVLSHSLISHKEISFIYPALPPAIILAGLGTIALSEDLARLHPPRARRLAPPLEAMAAWCVLSVVVFRQAEVWWVLHAPVLQAQAFAAGDPALCGLGVRKPVTWGATAGDFYLGRSIPIYGFATTRGAARAAAAVNYVIGGPDAAEGLPGFSVVRCWADGRTCLARAPAGRRCTPDPRLDINALPDLGSPATKWGAPEDAPDQLVAGAAPG
jgi:hypothetical protein